MPLIVTDDIEQAADAVRPMYALYFGGMGAKNANFHANVAIRMGYEAEVAKIQELYLSGHKDEAAAAVPTKLIEQLTLIGPKDKIRHDLEAWRESIVTTLLVGGDGDPADRGGAGAGLIGGPEPGSGPWGPVGRTLRAARVRPSGGKPATRRGTARTPTGAGASGSRRPRTRACSGCRPRSARR